MRELLRSTDPVTFAMAKALLDGEGITSFVLDVHMSLLYSGMLPQRLMVADRDAFRADRVLRDNGISGD